MPLKTCAEATKLLKFRFCRGRKIARLILFTAIALLAEAARKAASARQIDSEVNATLDRLYRHVPGGRELAARAAAVLVFPTVIKAGESAVNMARSASIGGSTAGYYDTIAASFGFRSRAGALRHHHVHRAFGALADFRRAHGRKVGVDGSVASYSGRQRFNRFENITSPVVGIILDTKGLM
jgi:hypothetical protein